MKKLLFAFVSALIGISAAGQSIYTTYTECPEGAVDMGIVITREDGSYYNLYWGSCNIGAESPEQCGGFYAWGEIEEKETYTWENYAFGQAPEMKKYVVADVNNPWGPAIRLSLEDDVAHAKLGGKWRMPTQGEWLALLEQCDWVYEKIGDVDGYRITSRVNPENSIYLPIGGSKYNDVLYKYGDAPYASYWSSSLCLNENNFAWYITFNKRILSKDQGAAYRFFGFNVRPVSE